MDDRSILRRFLRCLLRLQNIEQGSIWIKQGGEFRCIEAMGEQVDRVSGMTISSDQPGIIGWVIENGLMQISKSGTDFGFTVRRGGAERRKRNVIICFPLILDTGEVYGAIKLIDSSICGARMNLDENHLELMKEIVNIGAIAITNHLAYSEQLAKISTLESMIREFDGSSMIIGRNRKFIQELRKIESFAKSDYPVMITGESGTGKELIAREVHRNSNRRDMVYLVQNCSAIPETLLESELFGHKRGAFTGATHDKTGLFEAADRGTVFLDEVGDMTYKLQARILRFLQDGEIKPVGSNVSRKVNVRIISATNVDLPLAISKRRFRRDLYYRLNVLPIQVPSLRERREDIPLLLNTFLMREARKTGVKPKEVSAEAMRILTDYSWKGNVRELENFAKHIMVVAGDSVIRPQDLPRHISNLQTHDDDTMAAAAGVPVASFRDYGDMDLTRLTWVELEKEYVRQLLHKNNRNISQAAKDAGLVRSTFDSRMKKLGLTKRRL